MYNAGIAILLLAPVVILIYGAFFRKIEEVNEQPEDEDKSDIENDYIDWDIYND